MDHVTPFLYIGGISRCAPAKEVLRCYSMFGQEVTYVHVEDRTDVHVICEDTGTIEY